MSTNLISLPSECRGDRSGMGGGGAADRPPTPPGRSRWGGGGGTPPEPPPPLVGGGGGGIRGIVAVGTLCLNNQKIPNRQKLCLRLQKKAEKFEHCCEKWQMFGAIIKICVCFKNFSEKHFPWVAQKPLLQVSVNEHAETIVVLLRWASSVEV